MTMSTADYLCMGALFSVLIALVLFVNLPGYLEERRERLAKAEAERKAANAKVLRDAQDRFGNAVAELFTSVALAIPHALLNAMHDDSKKPSSEKVAE